MQNGNAVEGKDTPVDDKDWKWPCFNEWFDRRSYRMVREEKEESIKKYVPFKVIYSVDRYGIRKTLVELTSQLLIVILQDILPDNSTILDMEPGINAQNLYHVMEELRNVNTLNKALEKVPPKMASEKIYLNGLIKFLEQEYEQTVIAHAKMLEREVVSFDMLWVFYTPNSSVWYHCEMSDQKLCGIISSTSEAFDIVIQQRMFLINIEVIDYDSVGFKRCRVTRKIRYFDGKRSFSDLSVMPSRFSNVQELLRKTIAENGKLFSELARGSHFMNYKGPLLHWKRVDKCMIVEKTRADGRVMIDLKSFVAMNPDYNMGNSRPPNICDVRLLDEKGVYLKDDEICQENNYLLAPAVVYGFSFALKQWGQFEVSGFSEIRFDTDVLDYLVIPHNKKDMLKGLVRRYGKHSRITNATGLDPISNKGNGCIFLCYGPPGTGKTMTAECVAEFIERPLWMLSVNELGVNPEKLEQQLVKVLDIAYTWKAVLLLDEADIYLEKRNTSNLERNMMVGIFLRYLEYYQGLLFLATNRVVNFDDAICSRISMFLYYPKLGPNERREIWTNLIRRTGLPLKADDFVEYELNGREIRNIVHTAQILAQDRDKDLTKDLVIDVVEVVQGFRVEMDGFQKIRD